MTSILQPNDQQREDCDFIKHVEYFVRRWQPHDPRGQSEFAAELHYITRLIYREAQAPIFKQLEQLVLSMSLYPFQPKPPEAKP